MSSQRVPSVGRSLTTAERLRVGITRPCRDGRLIHYRQWQPADDLEALTDLLHRAYAQLAAAGLQYMASHQTSDVTLRRMKRGVAVVAVAAETVIGTITLADVAKTAGSSFYDRPDTASFGQFAVDPAWQHRGVGSMLMNLVESMACEAGARCLALDTSEQATGLIRLYETRGFRFVEHVQWPDVNYRSVVMAKVLSAGDGSSIGVGTLQEL